MVEMKGIASTVALPRVLSGSLGFKQVFETFRRPVGFASDEISDNYSLPARHRLVTEEIDVALEIWLRGDSNSTLLSKRCLFFWVSFWYPSARRKRLSSFV